MLKLIKKLNCFPPHRNMCIENIVNKYNEEHNYENFLAQQGDCATFGNHEPNYYKLCKCIFMEFPLLINQMIN
jgi:hypothetical protein